jgi:cytoplasmic iron level regulating protein YaaA (DUF328/UPF0246 family)
MLTLLTPSKTMDVTSPMPIAVRATQPLFLSESRELRGALKKLSVGDIQTLMNVSQPLATAVRQKFMVTSPLKPALWAYVGDVYKGFQAPTLSGDDALWAQQHLLIPSGLYGLLRPFDEISTYRLEMKAPLAIDKFHNLYEFWANKLGNYMEANADGQVLVLSSQEYAKSITPYLSSTTRIVTPAFIDRKPSGVESQVAIYNKMMRGVMARWIVDEQIDTLEDITAFTGHEYAYSPERSTPNKPVFYREVMRPLVFK